ncbi:hypothetical protein D3C77_265590 [compost metagenome]
MTVEGAKKSHDGKRGADRQIVVDPAIAKLLARAVEHARGVDISKVKDRLRAAGKELWPQRKAVPTMYTWRHQVGSDLKASGLSRVEIAFVMGHQSTESVDRYGNSKTARKGALCPRAAAGADMSHVRIDHKAPPGAPQRAAVRDLGKTDELHKGAFAGAVKRAFGGLGNDSVAPR